MSVFNDFAKFYAYLFHLALSIFFIGAAIVATMGHDALRMDMLPFDQASLISRLSMIAIVGFICIFLALVRIFEIVYPVWGLALLVILVWGFFFTSYSFNGPISFEGALLLIAATILAFTGR